MGPSHFSSWADLSNAALLAETQRLAANERGATAALVAALREVDSRQLYFGEGHSCMFFYCTKTLLLSEPSAYLRIEVARLSRMFPEIIEKLACGALTLTTTALIAPHLTSDNAKELFELMRFKTKREAEKLIAERYPRPDVETVVRKLPALPKPASASTAPVSNQPSNAAPESVPAPVASRHVVAPLSAATYKIQFTADQEVHDKLRHAQALLRHQIPSGDVAAIINKALTLLIADVERRKLGVVARPRGAAKPSAPNSRHIPAAVKRAVAERDKGRCAFVGARGRCEERGYLEFHHVVPYAAGGMATIASKPHWLT